MEQLNHDGVVSLLLTLGTLLASARLCGELASRWGQPAVLGEIVAGILLGPTVLGRAWPVASALLIPTEGPVAVALSGLTNLALVLFLLVAGLEVDLSAAVKQGRAAISLGLFGILVPFALGFGAAGLAPATFGMEAGADPLTFALFLATALSISALPVIAKTLMDLHLYRSDLGVVVMAAAVFNDLAGWLVFAVILSMMGQAGSSLFFTIASTLGYWVAMLVVGRWVFHKTLPWLQAYSPGPGLVLAVASSLAFFGAAFTEWIGVHAIFGSFMVGVALGDTSHLRQHVRRTLSDFVSFIFAPLFFASIGLSADFAASFDPLLVAAVFVIACAGKLGGCALGGRLGGMSKRETWAAAFGMNARGAMEIILGLLALRFGLIGMRLFVALVVMALATSVLSGPLMQRVLRHTGKRRVLDFLTAKTFCGELASVDRDAALRELCEAACVGLGLGASQVSAQVLAREGLAPTALGQGVAVPHARLSGLQSPVVAVGLSQRGVDFDAPDGRRVQLIFLLLTPADDDRVQLDLLADIAETCLSAKTYEDLVRAATYTEFRAGLMVAADQGH